MKFLDSHFDNYIQSVNKKNFHPKLVSIYKELPDQIENLYNLFFYGASGIGKYSQMLYCLKKYSPSELKYEKKLCILSNKTNYYYKISDIHIEIDMSLLGCNAKQLWADIYSQVIDIASLKHKNTFIIVCKNFHSIHSELLDNFYSYMQTLIFETINIKYIFISENISFLPKNILNRCLLISVPRPSKSNYLSLSNRKKIDPKTINNMKELMFLQKNIEPYDPFKTICDPIINEIENYRESKFIYIRELLYNILIYDVDVYESMYYITKILIERKMLDSKKIVKLMNNMYENIKFFNNNYRPIYHLEAIIYSIISIIYEL
jgi:hypothetical protein